MMKKLLFTVTSALLLNFTNSGYASPDINGLNDFPDEIKLHIALQLSTDDQKNLGMANKSFNAIMADDTVLTQKTARRLGINFDHIDQFHKEFFQDVREGNVAVTLEYNLPSEKLFLNYMDDDATIMSKNFRNPHDSSETMINHMNRSQNVIVGLHYTLRENLLEGDHYRVNDKTLQSIAFKYMRDKNEFFHVGPQHASFSQALGLNNEGSIVVGDAIDQSAKDKITRYGFVHKGDNDINFLNPLKQCSITSAIGVSDQGEVVTGWSSNHQKLIATVWFHETYSDRDRYHPCSLKDLVIHNCSEEQRTVLQYINFREVLLVSPNGKVMYASAQWKPETPDSIKQFYNDPKGFYLEIVFGKKAEPKFQNVATTD